MTSELPSSLEDFLKKLEGLDISRNRVNFEGDELSRKSSYLPQSAPLAKAPSSAFGPSKSSPHLRLRVQRTVSINPGPLLGRKCSVAFYEASQEEIQKIEQQRIKRIESHNSQKRGLNMGKRALKLNDWQRQTSGESVNNENEALPFRKGRPVRTRRNSVLHSVLLKNKSASGGKDDTAGSALPMVKFQEAEYYSADESVSHLVENLDTRRALSEVPDGPLEQSSFIVPGDHSGLDDLGFRGPRRTKRMSKVSKRKGKVEEVTSMSS